MPPTPATGSRMQAATQEPSRVETTTSGSSLTRTRPERYEFVAADAPRVHHASFPTTASIAAAQRSDGERLGDVIVEAYCRPRSISVLSGLPVTRMKPIRARRLVLAQRLEQPEAVEPRHVLSEMTRCTGWAFSALQRQRAVLGDRHAAHAHLVQRVDDQRAADRCVVDHHDAKFLCRSTWVSSFRLAPTSARGSPARCRRAAA